MVTKKIRTEYMKKFRDPKWETFSKYYEDSLRYRLTRRLMEHSHKPWFWEGWGSGSDSSGWSTPRLNKTILLSLPPQTSWGRKQRSISPGPEPPPEGGETDVGVGKAAAVEADPTTVSENGGVEAAGGSVTAAANTRGISDSKETDSGPAETPSSDGEPVNPAPRRRHRRGAPRSEPVHANGSREDKPLVVRQAARAKSQPPISSKENRWPSSRLDWTKRQTEVRRTQNDSNTSDACVQTRRQSDKRTSNPDRRRARSSDLEKTRRSQLTVVGDQWVTEYMRCFSARLR